MSRFASASARLAERVKRVGVSVAYIRGEVQHTIDATIGTSLAQTDTELGVLETHAVDWLVKSADFRAMRLNPPEPVRGDLIRATDDFGTWEYDVGAETNASEPPYRYSDAHHNQMRIHTVRTRQIPT